MREHTAEPWICCIDETVTIRDSQDNQLGILTHLHTRTGGRRDADEVAANARRIVACVNACKDVDNETLEKIASGDMDGSEIFELSKVKQQRDALLAALRLIMRYPGIREYIGSILSDGADSAIAAAEGGE